MRGALAVVAFNNFIIAKEERLALVHKLAREQEPRLTRIARALADIPLRDEWLGGQPNIARAIVAGTDNE